MDESDQKEHGKKQKVEINSSPASSPFMEINKNIHASNNYSDKPSKEEIINQALSFHAQGNIAEAEKYYQYFLNEGFSDPRVLSNYGIILKQLGKLKESESYLRNAIKNKPNFANAHYNLANTLKDLGKIEEAEKYHRIAIKLKPDFAEAHNNLGIILKDIGKSKEAEIFHRNAIKIKPEFAQAHNNLGMILKDNAKLKEAEISFKKAIDLNPIYAEAHNNLGNTLKEIGKLKEALNSLQKAIDIRPDFADAYNNIGILLRDIGKSNEAKIASKKAIEINPDLIEAKLNLEIISNQEVPKWHIPMMNDFERNNAYLKAINLAIKKNEYVLEIGTGSGLLSMMAIDAGAKSVVTCEASQPISEAAKKIISKNGYSDKIKVLNKKSTELNVGKDIVKKADIVISEILSSEFVGEGVQSTLSDANKRLIRKDGKMIPESGEIKIALLESSPEIEKELFVKEVNGYDLSEFNNIMGSKFSLHYLARKTKPSFLSEVIVPFSFDLYSKEIINKKEIILEIKILKNGICLGLITWLKLNLYQDISFENNPNQTQTSGWATPIYKFNQPLELSIGEIIKIKATLLNDKVWYELI